MLSSLANSRYVTQSFRKLPSGCVTSQRTFAAAKALAWRHTNQLPCLPSLPLLYRAPAGVRLCVRHLRPGPSMGRVQPKEEPRGAALLVRPALFAAMVCGCSFVGAAIWQYENIRAAPEQLLTKMKDLYIPKAGGFRHEINKWWHNLSAAEQVAYGIISVNVAVFAAWKLAGERVGFLVKYFSGSPFGRAPSLALVGSMFSHASFLHLAANMYVLYTFTNVAIHIMGKEQFVGFYLSAGVISSLASYAVKAFQPSLAIPSLGASGAILGVLGVVCTTLPQAKLQIAFIGDIFPHSFSADTAMKCLIAFDALGLILGWRMFDHAAHLGGILFGIWYVKYGHNLIWKRRDAIQRSWHKWRGGGGGES